MSRQTEEYEHLYVDEYGNLLYSFIDNNEWKYADAYLSPYMLSSIPVVFSKDTTVRCLLKIIENHIDVFKGILDYCEELLHDSKISKNPKYTTGKIYFHWSSFETNEPNMCNSFMNVVMVKEGEWCGIEFLSLNQILDLPVEVDCIQKVKKNDWDKESICEFVSRPTLFQVLSGLFWEMSFCGSLWFSIR